MGMPKNTKIVNGIAIWRGIECIITPTPSEDCLPVDDKVFIVPDVEVSN